MSRLIFALFAILVIFSTSQSLAQSKCPENEVWNSCRTACEPTCKNPNPICTLQCVQGCQCISGWIRSSAGGKCIPRSEC